MKKKYFQTILLVVLVNFSSIAQQTFLDVTFGTNGIITTEKFQPSSICIQQDGKIVVAGSTDSGGIGWDCVICRFNTDGTPDNSFGTNGRYHIIQSHDNRAVGIVEIPTGQLVVLATNKYRINDYATFIKLNSNGSLDTSYGEGGIQTIMTSTIPYQIVLSADGKILVAGQHRRLTPTPPFNSWFTRPRIQRYSPDLILDTSFAIPSYSWNMMGGATNISIDADGKIVSVYHYEFQVSDPAYKMAKFLPSGEPDLNFGLAGIKDIEIGDGEKNVKGFKILPDGRYLLSGTRADNTPSAFLLRTDTNGTTDATFAASGIYTLPNSSGEEESSIASVSTGSGKIVSALQKWNADNYDFGLLFMNENGLPDTTAAENGMVIIPLPGNQKLTCMAQQQDGKILTAGFDEDVMLLIRYDINDTLKSDEFNKENILIFPNPSVDRITIRNLPKGIKVKLVSLNGQTLKEFLSDDDVIVDISALASGLYYIATPLEYFKFIKK